MADSEHINMSAEDNGVTAAISIAEAGSASSQLQHSTVPPPTNLAFGQTNTSHFKQPYGVPYGSLGCNSTANIGLTPMQISSRQAMTKDLPNFSGKPKDCPSLSRITMRIHRSREFDQTAELLKGPALEAVRRRLMMTSRVGLAVNKRCPQHSNGENFSPRRHR
ncbi:unnamed protein product [Ceratitis capitata]|uniref:(Mediterranean fruit fly) hypothetical protein n=1 Tax=Ceratitis capitata TaxID=7213 RepID=A0A811USB3_CERCA|nr:unnamed protein product [Ceratitis capitata]